MRYWVGSILIHILIVSFVWVGFSVSSPRQSGSLIYLGQMIAPTQGDQEGVLEASSKGADTVMIDESSSALFGPWLKMRQLNKPR